MPAKPVMRWRSCLVIQGRSISSSRLPTDCKRFGRGLSHMQQQRRTACTLRFGPKQGPARAAASLSLTLAGAHLHVQHRLRLALHASELADLGHRLGLGAQLHVPPLGLELGVARVLAQALAQRVVALMTRPSQLHHCRRTGVTLWAWPLAAAMLTVASLSQA